YQIIAFDLLQTALLLLLLSGKMGGLRSLRDKANMKFHIIRGAGNFFGSILILFLFAALPLASAYTAVFLMPFMMTLIAIPIYKERVGTHRWVAMIFGFSGILLAFRPWESSFPPLMWVALLGAPLSFAIVHG